MQRAALLGERPARAANPRAAERRMATTKTKPVPAKAQAKPQKAKDEAPEKETPETATPDSPLLDLSDAAVRKMIKLAKKRGWVTHDQINAVMPSEEVTSDQIEDVFAMLNEMGINVVEQEEDEDKDDDEDEDEGGDLVVVTPKPIATTE
jgi:RNA polymerase primary sigma factor